MCVSRAIISTKYSTATMTVTYFIVCRVYRSDTLTDISSTVQRQTLYDISIILELTVSHGIA